MDICDKFKINLIVDSLLDDCKLFHSVASVNDILPKAIYHITIDEVYDALILKIPNQLLCNIRTHENTSEITIQQMQAQVIKSKYISKPVTLFIKDFDFDFKEMFYVNYLIVSRVEMKSCLTENIFYLMDGHHRLEVCKRLNLDLFSVVFKEKDVSILPMHRALNKYLTDDVLKAYNKCNESQNCNEIVLCEGKNNFMKVYGQSVDLYDITNKILNDLCGKDNLLEISYISEPNMALNDFNRFYCLNSTGFYMPNIGLDTFYKYIKVKKHLPVKSTYFLPRIKILNKLTYFMDQSQP